MYKSILLPIDPEHADASLAAAKRAKQMLEVESGILHLLTVIQPIGAYARVHFPEGFQEAAAEHAATELRQFVEAAGLTGLTIQIHVSAGVIYDQILASAAQIKPEIIVMASHRPALSDYLLGPNSARVVRHANCSVMVVRD